MLKSVNKKVVISLVVVLVLAGGFFYWQNRETPLEKWETSEISPKESYIIKETSEEKIVENKNVGLSFKIPKDWITKEENPASLHSLDAEFSEIRSDVLKNGCQIEVLTSYIKTNLTTLEEYLNKDFLEWSSVIEIDEFQKTEVSNYSALKYRYHVKQDRPDRIKMAYVSINIPSKQYLYKILLAAPLQEAEHCESEFEDFLETISINSD